MFLVTYINLLRDIPLKSISSVQTEVALGY